MRRTLAWQLALSVTIATLCLAPGSSRADFSISVGNNPQPDEENILLNTGEVGSTITGTTNQSGTDITFTSLTQTLTAPSNGQARVEAQGAGGTQVALMGIDSIQRADGGSFLDLIFNEFIGGGLGSSGITTITVNGLAADGVTPESFSDSFAIGNGSNFFTILATNGQVITSVSFTTSDGIADLRQIRISGLGAVPEPSSLALLALGMGSAVIVGLRRRGRKPVA